MQNMFGAGSLWAIRTDAAGVMTPVKFGVLQETSFEFSKTIKELHGSYKMPIAIGEGAMKASGKAKSARIFTQLYADIFFGVTPATGSILVAEDEAGSIPLTPFAITVANGATWTDDLGVFSAATGLPYVKVASGDTPLTGQYKCAASGGVYTFAAADTGLAVLINYAYTGVAGRKITLSNQLLGQSTTFQAWFKGLYNGKQTVLKIFNCVSSKLSLPTKMEDFTIQEFDFSMFVDGSNALGVLSTAE